MVAAACLVGSGRRRNARRDKTELAFRPSSASTQIVSPRASRCVSNVENFNRVGANSIENLVGIIDHQFYSHALLVSVLCGRSRVLADKSDRGMDQEEHIRR